MEPGTPPTAAAVAAARLRTRTGSKTIRGQISSPIPIPDPADDEFPILPGRVSTISSGSPVAALTNGNSNDYETQPWESPLQHSITNHSTAQDSASIPSQTPSEARRRHSPERHVNSSSPLARPTTSPDLPLKAHGRNGHQRKKSTLREALSKLFGRKKKGISQTSISLSKEPRREFAQQHRSVSQPRHRHLENSKL